MAASGPLDSFGTILSGVAKRLGLEPRLLELRLQHQWHDLVGEPIASYTWPAKIRFKQLYLTVQNSVWLQQLTFLKPTLLAKLNAATGTGCLTEIVLRVGQIPSRTPASSVAGGAPLSAGIARVEASLHTVAIQDPELRERFTEVISKYPSQAPRPPAGDPSPVP
jgi:predicted nucleic acid-binding Zn ribbon protein